MLIHHTDAFQQMVESVTHPDASTYTHTKFEGFEDECSSFQHWVILHGPISMEVAMLLAQLVEDGNIVYSMNTEHISLPSKTVNQGWGIVHQGINFQSVLYSFGLSFTLCSGSYALVAWNRISFIDNL